MKPLILALSLLVPLAGHSAGPQLLDGVIRILGETRDPQVQLDMLRGLREAAQGRPRLPMPAGWTLVEQRLSLSENPEIRALTRALGLAFGSTAARDALRHILADPAADPAQREDALRALLGIRDPSLPATLRTLLKDAPVRGAAIRALAVFEDPDVAPALLDAYPALTRPQRRDALNTLAARPPTARALLHAVETGTVPTTDLTAEVVQQLRNLKDEAVNTALTRVYGAFREVDPDRRAAIERYKRLYWAGGSTPGDAIRGRAVFAKVCQQCHMLFDVGGTIGPDLTGSNRGDLNYLLENILDPNAVIPNEYRASTVELRDGRVLTGILRRQEDTAVTIATANEVLDVPRSDIVEIAGSQLSMMPEELVAPLNDQEFRDLIYYLGRPGQAPMLATPDTVPLFFNGRDLSLWSGDTDLWSVEEGILVGRSTRPLADNAFLKSDLLLGDFRLVVEVKLSPNTANSGIQFRSEPLPDGSVKGYQADIGAGWWGKLYEEHGRALLWDKPGDPHVRPGDWNLYEIVAVGSRILTALNGQPCVDLDDPTGARQGIVALQLHSGGPLEVRFRNPRLELNPAPELTTVSQP